MQNSGLKADLPIRWEKIRHEMEREGADGCLLADNMNMYYAAGTVVNGYYYITAEGTPWLFVKMPNNAAGENVVRISKPEQIPDLLQEAGISLPGKVLLEADELTFGEYSRLRTVFAASETGNATKLMRKVRSVKTEWEIGRIRESAKLHVETYARIPSLYRDGMTDIQLQIEIEKVMRENGSIGLFRSFGSKMECFMGTVLAGDNAAEPSPFDFALGGKGVASSPIGASGVVIGKGMTVAVDMAGNYTEYITDMTRAFTLGGLPEEAYRAHQVSIDIREKVVSEAGPGTPCADIYNMAVEMSEKAGFAGYFMGTTQQARFVGHGIGLQINEMPVMAPRSKDLLEPGVVFALEPKFVLPGVGAVGVEDSLLVTENGIEKLTDFPDEIINFA